MKTARKILPLVMFLSACSFVPEYRQPALPQAEKWMAASLADAREGREATELGWREYFRDPQLQRLIDVALAHNHDLRRAALNVEKAAATYRIRQSERLPSVAGDATATRSSDAMGSKVRDHYELGLGLSNFELDFFGRVRALSQAARNTYLQTREARDAAQLAVIRSVAAAYYRARIAKASMQLAEKTLSSRQQTLRLSRLQFDAGLIGASTLKGYENAIETARADYYSHQREYEQAQNSLSVLLGVPYAQLPLPPAEPLDKQFAALRVPPGIPSRVLEQRPDIRAAEYALRAADANIGVAKAALFPRIRLTARFGYASNELDALVKSPNALWSLGPSLDLPIFNRSALRASVKLSELEKKILIERYQSAVAAAFQEVGDALIARKTYLGQYEAARRAAQAQHEMFDLEHRRFTAGIADGLDLLSAERDDVSARKNVLTTQLALLNNFVTLYTAMGGGLDEHAKDVPSAKDKTPPLRKRD